MSLRGLDLSGSRLPHLRLTGCLIEDCVLDGAELEDWRLWETRVTASSFRGAALSGSMGGDRRQPTTWTAVDLSAADLRDTAHHRETYVDCDFSGARLDRVDFEASRHVRSRFAGQLREVAFRAVPLGERRSRRGGALEDVDLTAATVRWSTFSGLDLSGCRFPASRTTCASPTAAPSRSVLAAAPETAVDLRVVMEGHLRDSPPGGGGPGFQHRLDLGETATEVEDAVRLMRSCGAV